jgi:hypothetical protein
VIAAAVNLLLSGESQRTLYIQQTVTDNIFRGINEGRMAARDVDSYLTGVGTQLPVTGGIVKRPPYELLGKEGAPKELLSAAA